MNMMETRNDALIPHFIPSILFILSNHEKQKEQDRINKMDMMETKNDRLIPHFIPSILFILSMALNARQGKSRTGC
jgi:hypothetical protein